MIYVGLNEPSIGLTRGYCLAEYPETKEGYLRAVTLIDHLIDHEHGIYYLDAPEDIQDED